MLLSFFFLFIVKPLLPTEFSYFSIYVFLGFRSLFLLLAFLRTDSFHFSCIYFSSRLVSAALTNNIFTISISIVLVLCLYLPTLFEAPHLRKFSHRPLHAQRPYSTSYIPQIFLKLYFIFYSSRFFFQTFSTGIEYSIPL